MSDFFRSVSQFFTCIEVAVQSTYQGSYFICDTFHSYMLYVLYQIRLVIFDSFLFFNHRLGVFIYCFHYAKCILYSIAIIATICNFIILLALSSAYQRSTICFIIIFWTRVPSYALEPSLWEFFEDWLKVCSFRKSCVCFHQEATQATVKSSLGFGGDSGATPTRGTNCCREFSLLLFGGGSAHRGWQVRGYFPPSPRARPKGRRDSSPLPLWGTFFSGSSFHLGRFSPWVQAFLAVGVGLRWYLQVSSQIAQPEALCLFSAQLTGTKAPGNQGQADVPGITCVISSFCLFFKIVYIFIYFSWEGFFFFYTIDSKYCQQMKTT